MKRLLVAALALLLLLALPLNITVFATSNEYIQADSGVSFTVPANWKQEALSEEREYIDCKFVSTKEDGRTIMFGSADVWEQFPASARVGYTRADINDSLITKAEMAEMFNTTVDDISVVTYNGVQYYKYEFVISVEIYGLDVTDTLTQLVHFDNGWMYLFQFVGASDHKLYSDFESLLNSVQYPTASNTSGVGATTNTVFSVLPDTFVQAAIAILLSVPVVIVIIVIISACNKKSKEADDGYISIEESVSRLNASPASNVTSTVICKNCGQELPIDSVFCHKCGTKIK